MHCCIYGIAHTIRIRSKRDCLAHKTSRKLALCCLMATLLDWLFSIQIVRFACTAFAGCLNIGSSWTARGYDGRSSMLEAIGGSLHLSMSASLLMPLQLTPTVMQGLRRHPRC